MRSLVPQVGLLRLEFTDLRECAFEVLHFASSFLLLKHEILIDTLFDRSCAEFSPERVGLPHLFMRDAGARQRISPELRDHAAVEFSQLPCHFFEVVSLLPAQ